MTDQPHVLYREAVTADIPQIQVVRNAVKENMLSNPALVSDADCSLYINSRGKGWVCETGGTVVGFAIADLVDHNIWALFVHPDYDKQGIGRSLHSIMLNWYFTQTQLTVWLSTAPGTRAAVFYKKAGWQQTGITKSGELRFEMTAEQWNSLH